MIYKFFNKRGMELAIPFLVLMTIILTISALMIFNLNSNRTVANMDDYSLMDNILVKEKQINFYINDIFENSVSEIQKGRDIKTQFIENFNKELNKYKNNEIFYIKELEQLEGQLDLDKINLEDKKISIIFKIEIGKEFPDKLIVVYSYEKEFSGFLN